MHGDMSRKVKKRLRDKRELEEFITIYDKVNPVETFPKYNLPTLESACYYSEIGDKVMLLYRVHSLPISDEEQTRINILYSGMYSSRASFNSTFYLGGRRIAVNGNYIDFRGAK